MQAYFRERITYLRQLLAVLLLFELLPVPVDLDVLLVRLDDLVLDLVCPLLLGLLLDGAALFVQRLSLGLNADDSLFGLPADLLKHA